MEDLTCCVGVFADLHLERNVPDVVQTKRYQATLNEAVDTERHYRVLVCSPLGEGLDRGTNRWPDEGEDHTGEDRRQTRDDWYETLACKEAQILRQLDAIEAVKHICRNRTRNDTAQNTRISQVFCRDFFSR